ncbi:MAG TPA: hypothetical protein VN366_01690 [Feifaniaceae bacterium]|nr:hypothetical protein [Feifaniaceae bacterium]
MRNFIRRAAMLMALLLLFAGCAKKQEPTDTLEIGAAAADAPPVSPDNGQARPDESPASFTAKAGVAVAVTDSAAWYFPGTLYGGVAYQNQGSEPVTLAGASFTFSYSGKSQTSDFTPVAAEQDVVLPGESGYCTLWLPYDDAQGAPENLTVTAELTAVAAAQSPQPLAVADARLIQNYPGFSTLSGSLKNPGAKPCGLNMVYAAFYGEQNKLLGVWYFTRNAVLQPGEDAAFVVHLQALPVEGLAEQTKEIRFRAFGM